jgi:hypothetical protein
VQKKKLVVREKSDTGEGGDGRMKRETEEEREKD